ncbi:MULTISPECIES: GNAT family N-acetyltransferase [unclassified Paenibacillus]|uniref:GNAT family N-acetyltransferase n=1 Tax=unclassified Paenibacillus TaxID=185978 RepID=UPI0004F866A7|nr:GNAT family N-acetyltransferase [Paenibacillus sp. FSL H7-0737]AIQ22869.1 GNAT family acetyltransferase [Paenibacillus sp. FSL H7-0737]
MIREAKVEDWKDISELLEQLGYSETEAFMQEKIEKLVLHPDEELLVFEEDHKVVACISMHYIPQLGLTGDTAIISYLVVSNAIRSKGIGRMLEEYCTDLARKRNCDRIQVHCHSRRTDAHRFYARQGFTEAPKYFSKMLNESE